MSGIVVPPHSLSIWLYSILYCCIFLVRRYSLVWRWRGEDDDGGVEGMVLRGLVLLCSLPPSSDCGILSFDGGVKGMVLRGLVLCCPLPPSRYCCIRSFWRWRGGYGPTGSGTAGPPPSFFILLYYLVFTVE